MYLSAFSVKVSLKVTNNGHAKAACNYLLITKKETFDDRRVRGKTTQLGPIKTINSSLSLYIP